MFVPRIVNVRVIDDNILVRRKRNPDMDLESGAMAMLMAWRDNGYATSRDASIVSFQPFDLFQYRLARRRRWFGAFEADLWCYLHFLPVVAVTIWNANPLLTEWLQMGSDGYFEMSSIDHSSGFVAVKIGRFPI
jgi:hypothetical protein